MTCRIIAAGIGTEIRDVKVHSIDPANSSARRR
jgi:hypothetical protein